MVSVIMYGMHSREGVPRFRYVSVFITLHTRGNEVPLCYAYQRGYNTLT